MKQKQITETVGLMMRVIRMHRCRCEEKLSHLNMHHSGHRMLMYIYRTGDGISQKELAKHFGISAAAASGTVKGLEKGGYIEVCSAKDDMRRYEISITEKGRQVAARSREIFNVVDETMVSGLTDEELEVFRTCLEKMKDNFERSKK